jgi:hypothetical protein
VVREPMVGEALDVAGRPTMGHVLFMHGAGWPDDVRMRARQYHSWAMALHRLALQKPKPQLASVQIKTRSQ